MAETQRAGWRYDAETHDYSSRCKTTWSWCRIHWTQIWYKGGWEPERFPLPFNIKTSRHGWISVEVFCGPGAYLPKRPA